MIQKTLDDFANGVLSRLENAYNDEILNTFNDMPKSIVKFNNTEALKKAQMYVRHTNRIFNRYFSRLIINLFAANGDKVSIAKDTKGECIFNKSRNSRIHFLSLEQVAGFPNVPWFKKSTINISRNSNTTTDIYVIMVKMDPKGRKLMNLIEYHTFNSPYQYIAFEDFIKKELGEKIHKIQNKIFRVLRLSLFKYGYIFCPLRIDFLERIHYIYRTMPYFHISKLLPPYFSHEIFSVFHLQSHYKHPYHQSVI